MASFSRYKESPLIWIAYFWPDDDISHITYNPSMKTKEKDFYAVAEGSHDSTLIFTLEIMKGLLRPLVENKKVKYIIGDIRHAVVIGRVQLKSGLYPGERERVKLPVKIKHKPKKADE